jgi:hypothetical protein
LVVASVVFGAIVGALLVVVFAFGLAIDGCGVAGLPGRTRLAWLGEHSPGGQAGMHPHPGWVSAGALAMYLVRVGSKEEGGGEVAYRVFAWAHAGGGVRPPRAGRDWDLGFGLGSDGMMIYSIWLCLSTTRNMSKLDWDSAG